MKISLLMFIIGVMFIIAGYVQQLDPKCKNNTEIRIIPRNIYDQLIEDATI